MSDETFSSSNDENFIPSCNLVTNSHESVPPLTEYIGASVEICERTSVSDIPGKMILPSSERFGSKKMCRKNVTLEKFKLQRDRKNICKDYSI